MEISSLRHTQESPSHLASVEYQGIIEGTIVEGIRICSKHHHCLLHLPDFTFTRRSTAVRWLSSRYLLLARYLYTFRIQACISIPIYQFIRFFYPWVFCNVPHTGRSHPTPTHSHTHTHTTIYLHSHAPSTTTIHHRGQNTTITSHCVLYLEPFSTDLLTVQIQGDSHINS
jgi:hypothetical protein